MATATELYEETKEIMRRFGDEDPEVSKAGDSRYRDISLVRMGKLDFKCPKPDEDNDFLEVYLEKRKATEEDRSNFKEYFSEKDVEVIDCTIPLKIPKALLKNSDSEFKNERSIVKAVKEGRGMEEIEGFYMDCIEFAGEYEYIEGKGLY